jgi:predicted nucleic acid-binding protein
VTSGYIDSSFLLSIVFEDDNYEKSIDLWNGLDRYFSSIFLEIETRINLYKFIKRKKLNEDEAITKEKMLNHLLLCINMKMVDSEINLEIKNYDKLKRTRSLDSIHLATAHILNKLQKSSLILCSYDKEMITAGKEIGLSSGP